MTPTHQLDVAKTSLLCGCEYTVIRLITREKDKEVVKYNYLDKECPKCKEGK